jgi:ATP-binding cassette subfamily C protein CydC
MGTSAYLIASAALHPSIAELQVAIVGVRFFGISRGMFRYLERLVSHSVNFRLLEQLRVWFYRVIEPLAPAGLQQHHSGDLLVRSIGDIETLENFYVRAVAPPLTAIIVTLGLGLYVGQMNWMLAGVVIIGLILSGLAVPWLSRKLGRKPGRDLVDVRAKLSTAMVDTLQGMAELLAFGAEGRSVARLIELDKESARAQERMARTSGLSSAWNVLITNLTLAGVLIIAIPLVRDGSMEGVTLAVLTLLTLSGFEAVLPLGTAAQHLDGSLRAGERLFEFAEKVPVVSAPIHAIPLPIDQDIVIRGLGFRYAPEAPWALRQFNLTLPVGKHIALVGTSGSGKTSLFNILLRFWEYQEGGITLGGHNIRDYKPEDVRRLIGLVPQTPFIFAGTLRHNLLLANHESTDEKLWATLQKVGLADWLRQLPNGLDTWIGERGMQISGGERQRISIARVILREPPLLLLDEPTANLDQENRNHAIQALQQAAIGRSSIWIDHQLNGLENLDEIYLIRNGTVVEHGVPDDFIGRMEPLI